MAATTDPMTLMAPAPLQGKKEHADASAASAPTPGDAAAVEGEEATSTTATSAEGPKKPHRVRLTKRERKGMRAIKVGRPRKLTPTLDPATGLLVVPRRNKAGGKKNKKEQQEAAAGGGNDGDEEEGEEEAANTSNEEEGEGSEAGEQHQQTEGEQEEAAAGKGSSSGGSHKRKRAAVAGVGDDVEAERQPLPPLSLPSPSSASSVVSGGGGGKGAHNQNHNKESALILRQLSRNKAGALFRSLALSLSYAPDCAPRLATAQALTPEYLEAHGLEQPLVIQDSTGLGPDALTHSIWPVEHKLPALLKAGAGGKGKASKNAAAAEGALRVVNGGNQEEVSLTLPAWLEYWASEGARFHRKFQCTVDLTRHPPKLPGSSKSDSSSSSLPYPTFLSSIDWAMQGEGMDEGVEGRMDLSYSVEGFYRDFHVPRGGASLWLHLAKGEMAVLLLPPTDANAALLEAWAASSEPTEQFLPLLAMDRAHATLWQPKRANKAEAAAAASGPCSHQVVLREGQTLLLPPCWALATLTTSPQGAALLSGRFFHGYSVPLMGRAFELEGRLAMFPNTTAPAASTASTTPESGSKGPPPLSAVEKALCHRTLDRYLTRLQSGGGGGPLQPRERQGVTLLVGLVRQGEMRRRLLGWPRPKGVLVTQGDGADPLDRLLLLLDAPEAGTSKGAEEGQGLESTDPATCAWCERARAAARRRGQREEEEEEEAAAAAISGLGGKGNVV